jgi:hypothetical protein
MARKLVLILSATALLSLFSVTVESAIAQAASNPIVLPGKVTCTPASGVWNGAVSFIPPLMNGGTANTEELVVQAALGNTASPCVATTGIAVLGTIAGTLTFNIAGTANNCATIFSGIALPAPTPASKFKMTWTTPAGSAPTKWAQPTTFSVTGAANSSGIAIKHGTVAGSFSPLAGPKATLSDANWPGLAGAVATGCASAGGLASLTLSTSTGKW